MKISALKAALFCATALGAAALAAPASAQEVGACLITKTDTNPFFVKMKEGAVAKAKELGVNLKTYAGKIDGDSESQVAAIESCIADGAKGILITASDTAGIVPSVKQASMPREAISRGYCCEVAPITPASTFFTPGQPPSMDTISTFFSMPTAFSAS